MMPRVQANRLPLLVRTFPEPVTRPAPSEACTKALIWAATRAVSPQIRRRLVVAMSLLHPVIPAGADFPNVRRHSRLRRQNDRHARHDRHPRNDL